MAFDAGWLALREPADHAARDPELLKAAARHAGGLVVDLGCGTGSTVRAVAGLAPAARWRLVDNDPALLAIARQTAPGGETVLADLADLAVVSFEGAGLVTASALLDLVSKEWLSSLADRLREAGAAFYAALTYDGVMRWDRTHPLDDAVTAAFNRDMRRDKGFGPALGEAGAKAASEILAAKGFQVTLADSPWRLGAGQAALERELINGIAAAAPGHGDWLEKRLAGAGNGCVIGHADLLAIPTP